VLGSLGCRPIECDPPCQDFAVVRDDVITICNHDVATCAAPDPIADPVHGVDPVGSRRAGRYGRERAARDGEDEPSRIVRTAESYEEATAARADE